MKSEHEKASGRWVRIRDATPRPRSGGVLLLNSPDCTQLTRALLSAIGAATRALWVASPIIDDDRIVRALQDAKARRVRVKVLTDVRNNRGRGKRYVTSGFQHGSSDAGSLESHHSSIRTLARSLIGCRGPTHYPHLKLVVVDSRVAFLSSANLTRNSLGGDVGSSLEVGLQISDRERAGHFAGVLEGFWRASPFRLILNESDVSIEEHGIRTRMTDIPADRHGVLFNSPTDNHFSLTGAIVRSINEARRNAIFASMSFFDTAEVPGFENAVLSALERGVDVVAIVRPEHFRQYEARGEYPDPSTKRLVERGMRLWGVSGLHAKGMLVDERVALLFSANLNPFSLTGGRESNHIEAGVSMSAGDAGFEECEAFLRGLERSADRRFELT